MSTILHLSIVALLTCCQLNEAAESNIVEAINNTSGDGTDRFEETALHVATEESNMAKITALIDQKVDINATDWFGTTALHIAAEKGNVDILTALINGGADVNATDALEQTALNVAAQNGHTHAVDILKNHGTDKIRVTK